MKMAVKVLLYWPNIIGYFRIGLVLAAWAAFETPAVFVPLYSLSTALDGVDGWVARRLGQTSRFGAWLDVVVDNLSRGMLWSRLYEWGWLVSALEWCVFVCNHDARGDRWKDSFTSSPALIRAIMANGFRTPLGTWVVSGLHCLPLWLYGYQRGLLSRWFYLPLWIQAPGTVLLAAGRLLALTVEMWCIWTHIGFLTGDDLEEKKKKN
ncbi:CDP-diacylglycerol--inositol 3-phosphatidyltransferase [Scomber scombrus]|uniref:CDP-diacylglycerol--inositol 3-phosphatidyltransferase n=1 Tax=Scomber scombrus TaxID=13677 RepID=A0AAV1PFR5_SCOSC